MRYTTAIIKRIALALLVLAAPFAADGQTARYHVVRLPEVSSPGFCVPTALNDTGDVVGYCNAGEMNPFAVRWRDGTVEDLGRWAGGTFTHAWAINSAGTVVGDGDDGDQVPKALIRSGGRWIEIDGSGGSAQQAYGITDAGVIFGNFTTQGGSIGTIDWDPVYWTYDADHDRYERHDLPKAQGTISGAFIFAITASGLAVGDVASDVVGNQAAMWNNDASHSLVVLPQLAAFGSTRAFGVSDDGRVAGAAVHGDESHAVMWQNDAAHTAVDLGVLAGDARSEAYGVNNAGQVVGISTDASFGSRGFLYQDGTMTDLAILIDPADGEWDVNPVGINNAGEIIALGMLNGQPRAVKLVPFVPAVSSVTITADRTAPQVVGTTVTFTAAATGGAAPVQFKWSVHDGSVSTTAQDWGTSSTFAWTPMTASAAYQVRVSARSAGNEADVPESTTTMAFPIAMEPVSAVTLTASRTAPQLPGALVMFTAAATDGVPPVEFKWFVSDGVSSIVVQDWSTTATFAWTPVTANASYSVTVWARNAGASADVPEQTATMPFAILGTPLAGVTLTMNGKAPKKPGETVRFTATAIGGLAPVEFKWLVFDGRSWTVAREWHTTATFAWTPATAGDYKVTVWARSPGATADVAEQSATMAFSIRGKAKGR